jgi:hypothetical protein
MHYPLPHAADITPSAAQFQATEQLVIQAAKAIAAAACVDRVDEEAGAAVMAAIEHGQAPSEARLTELRRRDGEYPTFDAAVVQFVPAALSSNLMGMSELHDVMLTATTHISQDG